MGTQAQNGTFENDQHEDTNADGQPSEDNGTGGNTEAELPEIDQDDPDAVALAEAMKEVKAEEADNFQDPVDENAEAEEKVNELVGDQEQEAEQPNAEDEPEGKDDVRIPKSRFDEVNQARKQEAERARQLELKIAELNGKLSASTTEQTERPEQKAPTPQDEISKLNTEIDSIWDKVDDGDLTAGEARRKERAIETRIRELETPTHPKKAQEQTNIQSDDLYLQERTNELIQGSQATQALQQLGLPENSPEWSFVNGKARQQLDAEGLKYNTPLGTLRYRQLQVQMIEENVQFLVPNYQAAADTAPATKPENKGPSPEAKERARKLELAKRQPASINTMADSGSSHDLSLEKLSELSEEEFDALPESVRNKAMEGIIE